MLGFGSVGSGAGGNSSSPAFSNLSALAPPFSIERLKPTSNNPIMQYSEPLCAIEPIWQYTQPSAPRSELILDYVSMGMPSMPVTDVYQFSASMSISPSTTYWSELSPGAKTSGNAFAYGGGVEPYYSPYAPSTVGKHNPLPDDDGPRYDVVPASGLDYSPYAPSTVGKHNSFPYDDGPQYDVVPASGLDYSPYGSSTVGKHVQGLYDLEYGPRWVDPLGSHHGKRAETLEVDGRFSSEKPNFTGSHSYNNHLKQGDGVEYENYYEKDASVSREQLNLVSDRDLHAAYTGVRHMEDKPCLEQNLSFVPSDSNKPHITAANSTFSETHSHGLPSEMHKNLYSYQNTCSTHKSPLRSVRSFFSHPVLATRSSSAVVIRPPSVNGVMGQNGSSRSTACNDSVGGAVIRDSDLTSSSNVNDLGHKSNSDVKEVCYDADVLNVSKQGNGQIFVSPSVKEFYTPLHTKNNFECNSKEIFVSQFSNLNVSDGFDTVEVVASAEVSSDSVDRHNLSVDSPCWKGASSSQFSSLDVDNSLFSYSMKNVHEFYGFEHENQETICSATDSMRTAVYAGEGNKNQEAESALDPIYPAREANSFDNAKAAVEVSDITRSIEVQINRDLNMPRKESGQPNNLRNGFDMNNSNSKHFISEVDTGLTLNDVSEGNIVVHAAEKVLASPSLKEDRVERAKLKPDPKMDPSTIIKAIHNLSELLCFHISNDASILEGKNNDTLKLIISNLDSCLSKKLTEPTNEQDLNYPIGAASEIGMSNDMDTISDKPHTTNGSKDSRIQLDYWSMYGEGGNGNVSSKNDEKSPVLSSLRDDLYITADDQMAKAIKNVLDENLNVDEEMHSQVHMYKRLWLGAEAKLCSITYRARFDQIKLEMEKSKLKALLGNEDVAEIISKINISPNPNMCSNLIPVAHDGTMVKPVIESSSFPSTSMHVDDVETSIMARFNILKSREGDLKLINNEEQKSEIAADNDGDSAGSVMDRFNILKSREDNSKINQYGRGKSTRN